MDNYNFVLENPHGKKVKTLIIFIVGLVVILALGVYFFTIWYSLVESIPLIGIIAETVRTNIINTTPIGLFYAHFLGGIFFVPSPDEVIFFYGLTKGNSIALLFLSAISGYMLAQFLNYFLGSKISPYILHFVSKRNLYKSRRYINRYGGYGIFIFNLIPSPAPLLTFALGIAKYNPSRLFILTFLGKGLKYIIVILIFLLT